MILLADLSLCPESLGGFFSHILENGTDGADGSPALLVDFDDTELNGLLEQILKRLVFALGCERSGG